MTTIRIHHARLLVGCCTIALAAAGCGRGRVQTGPSDAAPALPPDAAAPVTSDTAPVMPDATPVIADAVSPADATAPADTTAPADAASASISEFSAARATITAGTATTITARFAEATGAVVDQGVGEIRSGIPVSVAPAVTTTYTLTVTGAARSLQRSLTITVVKPPAITSFTATPALIASGGNSQLTAVFSDGQATIDGIGAVPSGHAVGTGRLAASTTFKLTVTNAAADSVTAKAIVTVGYTVTFVAGVGGSLTGMQQQLVAPGGSSTPVTATAEASHRFTGWSGPGFPATQSNPLIVHDVMSDLKVTASFMPAGPMIVAAPANQTVKLGATVTFTVMASGLGTLHYQWSKNGTLVPGATASSYTTSSTTLDDDGAVFSVAVSDDFGSVTASATLTLFPDLAVWLKQHPDVARNIKWQKQAAYTPELGAYTPPAETDKIAWPDWSQGQKDELDQAYRDAMAWFDNGAASVPVSPGSSVTDLHLTDQPYNTAIISNTTDDNQVFVKVGGNYFWKLYLAHVAFSLMLEINHRVPWSLAGDPDSTLRYLLDSTTMAWKLYTDGDFKMGELPWKVPALRASNLPQTAFGDPRWIYAWLNEAHLIGATRGETIERLLEWMRRNLSHFYGTSTFGSMFAVWQYRGYAPLSRIVAGTIDSNNPSEGLQHWTAGCHGSVGLLQAALRALNVPVQPIWVCGHELAYFPTEDRYLDHGDDPYNLNVSMSSVPIGHVLIDSATWKMLFGDDLTANITDDSSPHCANVGYSAVHFH
jgi:hypothetical protein